MISCREATSLMTDAREGELSGSRRAWFTVHMAICLGCRAYRRQLELAIAATRDAPRGEVPAEVEERILEAFRARKTREG